MKRRGILAVLCCFAVLLFCGCNQPTSYPFWHNEENIEEIYIVYIEGDNDSPLVNSFTKKKKIEDKSAFLSDFKKLSFQKNTYLTSDGLTVKNALAFLFVFENGDEQLSNSVLTCYYSATGSDKIEYYAPTIHAEYYEILNKYA